MTESLSAQAERTLVAAMDAWQHAPTQATQTTLDRAALNLLVWSTNYADFQQRYERLIANRGWHIPWPSFYHGRSLQTPDANVIRHHESHKTLHNTMVAAHMKTVKERVIS
jgi:hypothetical protein